MAGKGAARIGKIAQRLPDVPGSAGKIADEITEGAGEKIVQSTMMCLMDKVHLIKLLVSIKAILGIIRMATMGVKSCLKMILIAYWKTAYKKAVLIGATLGTHVYNPTTRQWAFYNAEGSFNTAFKLSPEGRERWEKG